MRFVRVLAVCAWAATALAACRADGGDSKEAREGATTSSVGSTSTTLPAFPSARANATLEHGMKTWAVVLAGARTEESAEFASAMAAAKDAGYEVSGPSGCDTGDGEALGTSDEEATFTVSVYFETEDAARRALTAFRARGVTGGVAEVTLYCLD